MTRPHVRPSNPHIWAQFCFDQNLDQDSTINRIINDMEWFNSIFLSQCNYNLTLQFAEPIQWCKIDIQMKAEEIDDDTKLSEIKVIDDLRKKIEINNEAYDHDPNTNSNPPCSVIVAYVNGEKFKSGKIGYAYDTNSMPYVVLIPEAAGSGALAHEIGHVLNYTNSTGNKDDAEPDPTQPSHNVNPGNLMYHIGGDKISDVQCKKFRESTIILRP